MAEPKRHTIGAHIEEEIYIEFDSPNIICYLILAPSILLKARFVNCRFIENIFLKLYKSESNTNLEFSTPKTLTMNPDPPTGLSETKVTKLLHLKSLAEIILDDFTTCDRIIRNPLPGTRNSLPQKNAAPTQLPHQLRKPLHQPLRLEPLSQRLLNRKLTTQPNH